MHRHERGVGGSFLIHTILGLGIALAAAGCTAGGGETGDAGGDSGPGSGGNPSGGVGTGNGALCEVSKSGIAVSKGAGTVPSITWSGKEFAIAWTSYEKDQGGDIHFALIDKAGNKLTESVVNEGAAESKLPHVSRLGSGDYLVLWYDVDGGGSKALGRYVSADGSPKGNAFQLAGSKNKEARPNSAVTASGGLVAAWMDSPGSFVGTLGGSQVSASMPINPAGYPVVASSGDASAAVWIDGSRLAFARLSNPLSPMAPSYFRDGGGVVNVPRLAPAGGGAFVATWEDGADDDATVFMTRIGADGKAGNEINVPTESGSANFPDVAVMGDTALVAYYQFRDGPAKIFLARVTADGAVDSDDEIATGKYPRMAVAGDQVGLVYAQPDGPVKLAIVDCSQ